MLGVSGQSRGRRALAWAIVVVSLPVLVAAGCGGDDAAGPSDEVLVRRTVVSWYAAIARGDGEKACALMTAAGRRRDLLVGGGSVLEPSGRMRAAPASCEAQVTAAGRELQRGGVAAEIGTATVAGVRVLDDQATATAEFAQRGQTLVLRRVAGRWLVDGARG
jgi:hypothetical protein